MSAVAGPSPRPSPPRGEGEELRVPQSPGELFRVFNRLALQGFGGVLPVTQYHLVERERWLTKEQLLELLSVGQVLPGPNVVNIALMIGDRYFGWRGALAALAGMLLVPMLLVLLLTSLYTRYAGVPAVAGALRGMGAVAAGLITATGLKLLGAIRKNPLGVPLCIVFGVASFIGIALLRLPLAWVLLGLGGVSCVLTYRKMGRTGA
jgi:chromate transporter